MLGHNYYLYLHPTTNRLHFIPWDLDRAFANFPILGSNRQQMDLSFTHPYAGTHRLTERLLAVPGGGERYQKLVKELAATCFEKQRLLQRLEAVESATKELVERDAKAAAARKDGGSGFGPPGMFGKPPALKEFIEKRTASVAAQVAGTSKGYVPTGGPGGGGPPQVGAMLAGPMLAALDTDRDEKLSRDEWLAASKKLFAACAKDGDGRVDQKSLTAGLNSLFPPPPQGTPPGFNIGGFLAGPILTRADANKDGKLTSEELLAAAGVIFDEFDKRKAGKLDEETFGQLLTKMFPVPNFGRPPGGPPRENK